MPQSLANVLLHIVFSTKNRAPFLQDPGSVSQSNVGQVSTYIANQDEHHRKMTYQDELRILLKRHEIEFDERYVWD